MILSILTSNTGPSSIAQCLLQDNWSLDVKYKTIEYRTMSNTGSSAFRRQIQTFKYRTMSNTGSSVYRRQIQDHRVSHDVKYRIIGLSTSNAGPSNIARCQKQDHRLLDVKCRTVEYRTMSNTGSSAFRRQTQDHRVSHDVRHSIIFIMTTNAEPLSIARCRIQDHRPFDYKYKTIEYRTMSNTGSSAT